MVLCTHIQVAKKVWEMDVLLIKTDGNLSQDVRMIKWGWESGDIMWQNLASYTRRVMEKNPASPQRLWRFPYCCVWNLIFLKFLSTPYTNISGLRVYLISPYLSFSKYISQSNGKVKITILDSCNAPLETEEKYLLLQAFHMCPFKRI